ncbi:hypothetical protein [Dyadobacter arcticus]|uniref:Uncharacterized protein n=1 Tax=Dyadobacter arcticus TaxID=1078754 RepID=A0ABX0UHQ0_9BACT|nr:hypothetical protein [Dyadobacter arcticus]NIJ52481.1 hypothetical protein [Dyadobacter arcticus]
MLHIHKIRGIRSYRERDRLDTLGSHDLIINATFTKLLEVDKMKALFFNGEMVKLKAERLVADYREQYIDQTRSIVSFEIAKNVIKILSETLKL